MKPLRPHPPLPAWYGAEARRAPWVRGLFDRTARHYDRINGILSLGTGRAYRRRALRWAGIGPGMRVLDVATGTGILAREVMALVGPGGAVIGLDPSTGMLAACRAALGPGMPLLRGEGENLPIADASVDAVTLGYALRHMADLRPLFAEFRRVLRPGGIVLVLEKTRPRHRLWRACAHGWFGLGVPALSRIAAFGRGGDDARALMRYYWDTVEHCVPPETILAALAEAGFAAPRLQRELDLFGAYAARAA